MIRLLKKYIFWSLAATLFLLGVSFAFNNFNKVFSIVNINITMDRKVAITAAESLSQEITRKQVFNRRVAFFSFDGQFRNYVELEGGGTSAYSNILKEQIYSPYTWQVRLFSEGLIDEVSVKFTPTGTPYGFFRRLPKDAPGKSLSKDVARDLAKRYAKDFFGISFDSYRLIESANTQNVNGRKDYTFEYERLSQQVGDAFFRLRLRVSGDKFTELTHYLKIPETFSRKFLEMRSSNELISQGAYVIAVVVYVFIGVLLGLFFLLKRKWVLWRIPLLCGITVAFLELLGEINYWPLIWVEYDTALSAHIFFWQQISDLFRDFVIYSIIWTLSFMAAESLTRRAFPRHIQFWRIWSPGIANSTPVLKRTLTGYLMLGFSLPFIVVVYLFGTRVLGWWLPSDTLLDPNILASYFPWISVISNALRAGFWEECLFRAVPIAGAALVGNKVGKRSLFVGGAIIFQALVFGALHANYSQQPSYSRVIELFVPAVIYGCIYFFYGLLPVIITHFVYDAILFALPLFVIDASGIFLDRLLVGICIFIPLIVIITRWLKTRAWYSFSPLMQNAAWVPRESNFTMETSFKPAYKKNSLSFSMRLLTYLMIAGALVVWALSVHWKCDSPPFTISQKKAVVIAKKALLKEDLSGYSFFTRVVAPLDEDDRFVWEKEGKAVYASLLGNHVWHPYWHVRVARFLGTDLQRSEEYNVFVDVKGGVFRIQHILPEIQAGAFLPASEAQNQANEVLNELYGRNADSLKSTLKKQFKLPNRRDWAFEFSEKDTLPSKGEKRFSLRFAGDKLVDYYRYVYIPEAWARLDHQKTILKNIFLSISKLALIIIVAIGIVLAVIRWHEKQFSFFWFKRVLLGLFIVYLLEYINGLPTDISLYSTAEPFWFQFLSSIGQFMVNSIFMALVYGVLAGMIPYSFKCESLFDTHRDAWSLSLLVAVISAAALAVMRYVLPQKIPFWPNYSFFDAALPWGQGPIEALKSYIKLAVFLSFVFSLKNQFRKRSTVSNLFFALFLLILGNLLAAGNDYALAKGLLLGTLFVISYFSLLRFNMALLPLILGGYLMLNVIHQLLLFAYPYSWVSDGSTFVVLAVLSHYWYRSLRQVCL